MTAIADRDKAEFDAPGDLLRWRLRCVDRRRGRRPILPKNGWACCGANRWTSAGHLQLYLADKTYYRLDVSWANSPTRTSGLPRTFARSRSLRSLLQPNGATNSSFHGILAFSGVLLVHQPVAFHFGCRLRGLRFVGDDCARASAFVKLNHDQLDKEASSPLRAHSCQAQNAGVDHAGAARVGDKPRGCWIDLASWS